MISRLNDDAVNTLLSEDYEAILRRYPTWASMRGERRFDALLADNTPEGILKDLNGIRDRLERARVIRKTELSSEAQTNLELLIWELEEELVAAQFHPEWMPITQMGGPHTNLSQLPTRIRFTSEQHLRDYLLRLREIPGYLGQTLRNLQMGLKEGYVPPRVVMKGVMDQMESQTKLSFLSAPSSHPLYQPFANRDNDDNMATQARLVIRDEIIPAFQRLSSYLKTTYIPACRDTIAAKDGPGGLEFYQFRLKHYTTLSLTPEAIHNVGLKEVGRIRKEMMAAIKRSDFDADKKNPDEKIFDAFVDFLRTDPRFYYTSVDDMLRDYSHIAKSMDAELPKLFGKLPRLPYGIKPMPEYIAQSAPTAYYYEGSPKNGKAGTFIVNTTHLNHRPKYEMKALTYHEAMPGHHLQIALSQELAESGLHLWRELIGYTVFVEGWGLYSERLGLEVGGKPDDTYGFYQDPYDDFGRLSFEMWRALRLVVDTGLHAFDWSREKAIEYMLANSALTRKNVENEVDRYIAWPGQAVAYKIGELKIRQLRETAEKELGEDFDVRGFHDIVLAKGAVPLEILIRQVHDWIVEKKK